MTARRPVLWAVVHDLSRTGVPIALARLATWPNTTATIDLHVISRHDGPLRADLERAGISVVTLEPEVGRTPGATVAVGAARLGRPGAGAAVLRAAWRRRVRSLPLPTTVLVQGAGAWPVAESLGALHAPRVVVHLHELGVALGRSLDPASLPAVAAADHVLVVSRAVGALAQSFGVPSRRLSVVPGTVGPEPAVPRGRTDVVSVGDAGWRKGTDRAIAAAHLLGRTRPELRWHWIGRGFEPGWAYPPGTDLPVAFAPPTRDPWSHVRAPAALVVTSREDPLPLVALEAGARGLPVVACAGSGGLDELLAEGRGWLIEPTDPHELAATVAEVAANHPAAEPERLRAYVTRHHGLAEVGPRWLDALLGPT